MSNRQSTEENIARNIELHRFKVGPEALERTAIVADRWHQMCSGEQTDAAWEEFLSSAALYNRGAAGLYTKQFRESLPGRRVLDFGSGRGINAAAMAGLGADVVAVDISPEGVTHAEFLARRYGLEGKLTALAGDIRTLDLEPASFDIVVGQNILHHLVHDLEREVMEKLATLVKPDGVTIFVELAHNSKLLVQLTKLIWFPHHPSILQRKAYAEYMAHNPHPERDNSSAHFEALGQKLYHEVEVVPFGGIERLVGLIPGGRSSGKLRSAALRVERRLPRGLNRWIAAAQTITLRRPRVPRLPR